MNLAFWADRHMLACHLLDNYTPVGAWYVWRPQNCREFLFCYWKLCERKLK